MDTDSNDLLFLSGGGHTRNLDANLISAAASGMTSPLDLTSDPIDNAAIVSPPQPSVMQRLAADPSALMKTHPATRVNDYRETEQYVADTSKVSLVGNSADDDEPIDDTADPHAGEFDAAHDHPTTSTLRTFINFMKGNIGTGVLAMPDAIKNAGLFVGTGSLLLLGLLSTYCCHQLLHAYVQVSKGKPIGYARVVELVFWKAGGRWRKFAKPARWMIDTFLVITQFGFCCVYILFCSKMIKEVIDSQVPPGSSPSIQIYETCVLALLIPYCFVTTLKALSLFTLFANVVTVATLVIVLQYVFRNLQPVEDVAWYPIDINTVPLFFGTAMFAFESIGLILPIENRMKDRDAFHHWNGLLSTSMVCIICLYCTMGFYGYLAFGSDAKMILSNLPEDDWLYLTTKLMYACSIFISYNLQLYVPIQIMYPTIKTWVSRPWFDRFGEYIFRTIVVVFTFGLAVGIPCLELMISLFGALCSSGLALIFPPVVEVVCCLHKGQRHRLTFWLLFKNSLIFVMGVFGTIIGTFVSIQSIVNALASPEGCGA